MATITSDARTRRWIILFVLAFATVGGLRAGASRNVGGDFLRYHRAGRLVATGDAERLYDADFLAQQSVYADERKAGSAHGSDDDLREAQFKYAPAFAVLMAPLGTLHPRSAWTVWGAWNGLLIGLTFVAAWKLAARGASWRWMLVAGLVLVRAVNENMNLGQVNPSAIAPATLALVLLDGGRSVSAGLTAAFGTVVKFLPGLLAIWFVVKRRWMALASLVGGVVLFGVALPALVLGPARSIDVLHAWWKERHSYYTGLPTHDLPGHSIKSFVYRVFGGTHYRTGSGAKEIDWDVSIAQVDPRLLAAVVLACVLVLLGLIVLTAVRRERRRLRSDMAPAGLFFCWIVLASPEARSPHLLYLALPVTLLTYGLVRAWREGARGRQFATALAVVGSFLLHSTSETLLGRTVANVLSAFCAPGWGIALLMTSMWIVMRNDERAPIDPPDGPAPSSPPAQGHPGASAG